MKSHLSLALLVAGLTALYGTACSGDDDGPVGTDAGVSDVDPDSTDGDTTVEQDTAPVCVDNDGDGFGENCDFGYDCNDQNRDVHPGTDEVCGDGIDNNCDGEAEEGCPCTDDAIRECYGGEEVHAGIGVCSFGTQTCVAGAWGECIGFGSPREEMCDFLDNDCDGEVDEELTNACGGCGAVPLEVCGDLLDNDCNGLIDDVEGCSCEGRNVQPCYSGPPLTLGIGTCHGGSTICEAGVITACVGEVLPGEEVCDGRDNNCDGRIDEGLANACGACGMEDPLEVCDGVDNDCDGEIDEGLTNACGLCGTVTDADECDGVDNNCDGQIDEGCACNVGDSACWPGPIALRGIGACTDGDRGCDSSGEFWGECEGAVLPSFEICDGLDNDCNGTIDVGPDGCSVCGVEEEICDGIDNNCDGQIDEGLRNGCGQCIADVEPEEECGSLCCDGIDNDCDGFVDEGLVNACGQCDLPCWEYIWNEPEEFMEGDGNGVDTTYLFGLQLGSAFENLPYLWVANSGDATVSRINTETIREEGRFPVGQSPSRTAVDFDGNVYVANRAFSGQGTVTRVSATGCTADECVVFNAPVGPSNAVPRGMAIDSRGFPWVGSYNDGTLRRLDPDTGVVLEEHFIGAKIYGISIDSEGIIWISNLNIPEFTNGQLLAFDTNVGETVGAWSIPGCSNPYGIAVDGNGRVWLGNYTCNNLVMFDRDSESFSVYSDPSLATTRGVAVDGDGYVWVASYATDRVGKFDPVTGSFVGTYEVCDGPMGVAVANDGHIWVPCYASDNVVRIAPDGSRAGEVAVGRNPYSYSDMNGFQLVNFTARIGTWDVTYDCGFEDCIFDEVRWTADVPALTEVQVRARTSVNGTDYGPWTDSYILSPADLHVLAPGRYVQIEVMLRTSDDAFTPTVPSVELYWQRP